MPLKSRSKVSISIWFFYVSIIKLKGLVSGSTVKVIGHPSVFVIKKGKTKEGSTLIL
jgi:hypothetical protein